MMETLDTPVDEQQQAAPPQQAVPPQRPVAAQPAPPAPRNEYDDLLEEQARLANQHATQAVAVSVGNEPDAVGRAQRLAAATGAGVPAAMQDPKALQKSLALQQLQQRNLALHDPVLALQLANPDFAAIAHDDVDNLHQTGTLFQRVKQMGSDLSRLFLVPIPGTPSANEMLFENSPTGKDLTSAYDQGHLQFERGMLAIKLKRGIASPNLQTMITGEDGSWQRIREIDAQLKKSTRPQTLGGNIFGGVFNMTGSMLPMVPHALGVSAAGAGIGALAGLPEGGVGAIPGAITGAGLGFESEFGARNYEMMAGNAYADMLERGVDEDRAQWAAGAVGAVNTALQLGLARVAGKPLSGVTSKLFNRALGDTVAEAMTQPTTAAAVKSAMLAWGKNTAIGTGEMGLQTIVDRVGQDFADKKGAGGTASDLFSAEFGKQLGNSLIEAAKTMGAINATTGMMGYSANMDRVRQAEQSASFFEDLSKGAVDSKVRGRNPAAYQDFLANQAQGTPAENIYIDGKEMANLLHQSGITPEALDADHPGLSQQLAEAVATGGDVTMPTAEYGTHLAGTPLGKAMQAHMRMNPDAMSATEALTFQQKQNEFFEQTRQEAQQQTANGTEFAKSAQAVEANIYDQLKATKTMPDDAARTNAQFVRDFVVTQAARQRVTPESFFDKYKYTILKATGVAPTEADLEERSLLRQSDFGTQHEQFYHDAKGAVDQLLKDKSGDAIAALHHPDVGDIDLVYGSEGTPERNHQDGFGLAKIAKKHPAVLDDLQGLLDGMKVTSRTENRIQLADDEGKAAVRLNWEGKEKKWLLTAFRSKEEGESATGSGSTVVADHTEPAPNPAGQEADGASVSHPGAEIDPEILHQEPLVRAGRQFDSPEMAEARSKVEAAEAAGDANGVSDWTDKFNALRDADPRFQPVLAAREAYTKAKAEAAAKPGDAELARKVSETFSAWKTEAGNMQAAEKRPGAGKATPGELGGGPRGGFDPSSLTTLLGKKADMSTFLHETAHYFLSVYSEIAKDAEGDAATKEDFGKLLEWFGVKDQATWDAMSLDQQRKYHEQFAYSFEKYLEEGKAPTPELQAMFGRFSQWLKRVYRSVRDDTNSIYRQQHGEDLPILTGEVRDVMDRMLASDEQIQHAQAVRDMEPVFKSQEHSGMDDAKWKAYGDAANLATEQASTELGAKSVREMQWMSNAKGRLLRAMQAQHEAIRKSTRLEVEREMAAEDPVYRAQRFLRTGEWEGEATSGNHKMDTEEARKLLPEGMNLGPKSDLFGMTKKDGLHPDLVAAAAGFRDGKEMVDAMLAAPSLKDAVDAETDRRMLENHGDIATPNGMAAAVEKAVHNEARARFIAFEMRHAFNMTESERVLVQAARETARKAIERQKFAEIQPSAYAAKEAAAARRAIAAQARGDMEAVGRAKRDQLLQNAMATEALRVKQEADQHLSFLNKFDNPSKAITKAIGADHMDAINELLAAYAISPRDRYSDRRENMAAWIAAEYARSGVMPAVSDELIDQMGRMHWRDMNIVQLRDLRDAVKSLDYTGRRQMEVLLGDKRQTVDELVDAVKANLEDVKHVPVEDIRARMKYAKGLDKLSTLYLGLKFGLKSADAALLKMEQLSQWMDAGKDAGLKEAPIDGPMQRVYRLASAAESKERDMRTVAGKAVRENGEKLRGIKLSDALDIPELPRDGNTRWYRGELIALALNMGNQSNMEKLLAGYGWQHDDAMSAVNRLLSPAEMSYVQGTWDHLATYGDGIRELQRRQTGVSPRMIEARPLVTKHGTYEGGYYPVVYNDVLDDRTAQNQARQADMLFENNYANPSTASGHTIERNGYIGPMFLDLGVIARHIDQVTHDLAWREAVIDMNKILSDERLIGEVNQVYGREYSKQFRPWLQAMANDKVFNTSGDAFWEKGLRTVRGNATMVGIGFRLSTMAIHGTTALSNSLGELGMKWFVKGTNQFVGVDRFQKAREFVYERSPEMANRMNEADRNIHEAISEIEKQKNGPQGSGALSTVLNASRKFAFRGVGMLDMASALPTWMGAYLKGIAHEENGGLGMGEEAAIAYADRSVRNAHGGGGTKDMSAVQRSNAMSLFTMFYSYWNHVYNRQRDLGKGWNTALRSPVAHVRDFPKLLARSWFYAVIPPIAHALLSGKKKDDEDGASFTEELAKDIGLSFVAGLPGIRDAANSVVHGTDYKITPIEHVVQTAINSTNDAGKIATGKEPSKRAFQNAAETVGYATGLPTAQPAASARFLWDVVNGDVDPKTTADWWRGIMTGKIK